MPEMDGFEVADRIRNELSMTGITLMMLTSDDCADSIERCQQLNLAAHLVKPIKQSELLDSITTVLQRPSNVRVTQENALPAKRPTANSNRASKVLRVLLAEDNIVNQQLMVRVLERASHQVFVANNGREAVELSQSEQVDIILMDVQMPEMDGFEATQAIREREKNEKNRLPIVALTAHAMKGDREKCLDAGMDAYVSKPIQVDKLLCVMEDLVSAEKSGPSEAEEDATAATNTKSAIEVDKRTSSEGMKPILATDDLLNRVGNDMELLGTLIKLFREEYPKHVAKMQTALQEGDHLRLKDSAHSLKGSCGNIGGSRAAETAFAIEKLAVDEHLENAEKPISQLESEIEQLLAELNSLVKDSQASETISK